MNGYLKTKKKEECFGCEACIQICPFEAIKMFIDDEGFRYPKIDTALCTHCGLCNKVCPVENNIKKSKEIPLAFGGYHKDDTICEKSTSGGAFSAIVEAWADIDYIIFGAESSKLKVWHNYITDKKDLDKFRKSKYSQSIIGNSYKEVKEFLKNNKKVLFSGTPCQIAALKLFLGDTDLDNLLTVEVVCEGVPSPLFMEKYNKMFCYNEKSEIEKVDYRFKDGKRWDFQVMKIVLENGKIIKKDRWFNPYWSIWLSHVMSRPSCYECQFTTKERVADITLGDLWGVHLYCPELYGNNRGASLIVCNTEKGKKVLKKALINLCGHELNFDTALKYQSPMRKNIDKNENKDQFMDDLKNDSISYEILCRKWNKRITFKLWWSKYIWGNRQKVFVWNICQKFLKR